MKRKSIHQIADEVAERLAPALLAYTERAVIAEYGTRCPDHEPGCVICEAWRIFDKLGICPTIAQIKELK
jgi:hypothetical protein